MKYWIEEWCELRYKEMVVYPDNFVINSDYFNIRTEEELRSGFIDLFELLKQIYLDCSLNAESMYLPLHEIDKFRYLSNEERISRSTSNKYGKVFYALGCAGKLNDNGELCMTTEDLKVSFKQTHITGLQNCLKVLLRYGFLFDGLQNRKLTDNTNIILRYPANDNVPIVLHILSVKTRNTGKMKDFCRINYRLLKDDWNTANFGNSVDYMADLFTVEEQEVAYLIHEEMLKRNYFFNIHDWNEGPQIRYYKNEKDCSKKVNAIFWLVSMKTELQLFFRIKDMETGLEMINTAPDSVIQNFLKSENGCWNRIGGLCKAGVGYSLKGVDVWRCGCANPNFRVVPTKADYMFYIDLVETTQNKRTRK